MHLYEMWRVDHSVCAGVYRAKMYLDGALYAIIESRNFTQLLQWIDSTKACGRTF
jgi:hypothetical protein